VDYQGRGHNSSDEDPMDPGQSMVSGGELGSASGRMYSSNTNPLQRRPTEPREKVYEMSGTRFTRSQAESYGQGGTPEAQAWRNIVRQIDAPAANNGQGSGGGPSKSDRKGKRRMS